MTGDGPIFIGGLSYSGKTQVRLVLDAHPAISMTRRTYMWERFYGRFGDLGVVANLDRCLASMVASEGVKQLRPEPDRIRREFLDGPASYARLFGLFHQHHAERHGKRRWGDQLGSVERFADPIFEAFPTARMIHMIRDPRSRYAATGGGNRSRRGKVGWQTGMWMQSAGLGERNLRRYPDRYRVIRYETLATRPAETIRDLCGFIREDYLPSMDLARAELRFDEVIEVPDRGEPRIDIPPAGSAFVELYARRELAVFGYPVASEAGGGRGSLSFRLVDRPLNRATMTAWRVLGAQARSRRLRS